MEQGQGFAGMWATPRQGVPQQSAASITQMQHNQAQVELQRVHQQYYGQQQSMQQQRRQQRSQQPVVIGGAEIEGESWMKRMLQAYFTKDMIY
jgi:hypothetical protein